MNVAERPRRMTIGRLPVDAVTFTQAIDVIDALISRGQGGTVFTPNVDHVVQAEENERFRDAYQAAALSLVDGISSLEMILDVSGMPSLDALRILFELVEQRIISLRDD